MLLYCVFLHGSPPWCLEAGSTTEPTAHGFSYTGRQISPRDLYNPRTHVSPSVLGLQMRALNVGLLLGCWESELRSSCLLDFINWTISPGLRVDK